MLGVGTGHFADVEAYIQSWPAQFRTFAYHRYKSIQAFELYVHVRLARYKKN